jgi:hypothetical protein
VLLETPGILRKLSITCIGPYPVTNVYKNVIIRIQMSKRNCIRKSENVRNLSIESKAQLSIILGANAIP